MENNQKRILLNMAYYSLFGLSILFTVLFVLRIVYSNLPLYIQIIYYAWSAVLIFNLIFDLICTRRNSMKFISGIIYFILAFLTVVMAVDVFFMKGVSFRAITNLEFVYVIEMILNFTPITLAIYAYLFGEKIINFKD